MKSATVAARPTTPVSASAPRVHGDGIVEDASGHALKDGTVKSLTKGLRILEVLLQRRDVGPTEIAKAFSIDKGTASRILKTLVEVGFAVQGAGRRYQPGPKVSGVGSAQASAPRTSIRDCARPLLERLHQATGETAHLALRADDHVLYFDKVDADQRLRFERPIGTLLPLHCTAAGKIFLAFSGAPLPRKLTSDTSRTAVDRDALQLAMRSIVARGYATDDEEFGRGIRCVAAPLRDRAGNVVAALGLSGPTARMSASQPEELGELVKALAAEFEL
jgi:DNA-binding IclR family transcriptional regulator